MWDRPGGPPGNGSRPSKPADAAAAIRALAPSPPQSGWRDIASAPRHGNYVRVWTEEGALLCPNDGKATHWMPLPAPPQSEGGEG